MRGSANGELPSRPHSRKHQGIGMGGGRYRPPLRDRPSHRLWNRDQVIVGASKTIFALDLLALQAAIPCSDRDHEDILPVTSPGQTKELAGAQRAETGNQKDGPVAGRWTVIPEIEERINRPFQWSGKPASSLASRQK